MPDSKGTGDQSVHRAFPFTIEFRWETRVLKSHYGGDLRVEHDGTTVTLAGWVHRRRDHGGLIFIDLRDSRGIVQVVVHPERAPEAHVVAAEARSEYVISVQGTVVRRSAETVNPNLTTGDIEVEASAIEVLNPAKTPPFPVNEPIDVDEVIRLEYRFVDLRRDEMRRNLILRHLMNQHIRRFMTEHDFTEVETPALVVPTPEGARDYLVPSRLHPGSFYALPQSPQQFKQLLMVAGVERYFQIVRCFRDEDLRADRQPEFTQLDVEMAFCEEEDILGLMEELFTGLVRELRPDLKMVSPFPRLTYAEAMERYGTDKPDLRYGLELFDCTPLVAESEFGVFRNAVGAGGRVRGVVVPGGAELTRRQVDGYTELAKTYGAKGLVSIQFTSDPATAGTDDLRSPVLKHLGEDSAREIGVLAGAKAGDMVLLAADTEKVVNTVLDGVRREVAARLDLADECTLHFAFVTDFPLFEWDAKEKRWDALHHPFTAPHEEDLAKLEEDPGAVRSRAYDIVANGLELASGSIRIHRREVQERVFASLGIAPDEALRRFGHILKAFEHGAPPHGGIAPGLDRIAMLLAGAPNIREVIAFPKTQAAADPMTGAPAIVDAAQIAELGIAFLPRSEGEGGG